MKKLEGKVSVDKIMQVYRRPKPRLCCSVVENKKEFSILFCVRSIQYTLCVFIENKRLFFLSVLLFPENIALRKIDIKKQFSLLNYNV